MKTKNPTWGFLWGFTSEIRAPDSKVDGWRYKSYKGTFEQAAAKMARFLGGRCGEVELDYEASNDTPRHRYNPKKHVRTFPDLRKHPLLGEWVH